MATARKVEDVHAYCPEISVFNKFYIWAPGRNIQTCSYNSMRRSKTSKAKQPIVIYVNM